MTIERKAQDLFEALGELCNVAAELSNDMAQGVKSSTDAAYEVLENEVKCKIDLVTGCAKELQAAIEEREERAQNRHDGYGSAE